MLNLKLMSEKTEFELKTEQKRKEKKRVLCMYALRKNILTLVKETSVRKLSCDSLDESFVIVDCVLSNFKSPSSTSTKLLNSLGLVLAEHVAGLLHTSL